ncbi:jerky protein homolog-like [Phlebotomus papatasi]|uniref:jerky protein homolog-like n=1 Tax=Phlebotomus papatasi TaxID=29031 RepID=UPI0024845C10|nr:jerky protein homolog-like [Phlebotomus papatasi]
MKRKHTTTKILDKVRAVERLQAGESLFSVGAAYNVGRQTLLDWLKQYEQLKESSLHLNNANRTRIQSSTLYPKTSEALFVWFVYMREKGMPVDGIMLRAKALAFFREFKDGPEDFCASEGWLSHWKKRNSIRALSVSGEALSSADHNLPSFMEKFQQLIEEEDLCYEQIYNADETGLWYKTLPKKTLAEKIQKRTAGYKVNKERVTILACANATGYHKLPLFVIGKSEKPRALKHVNKFDLPVKYGHQPSAWMSRYLFKEWFFNDFVPQVCQYLANKNLPQKAVLLLDNAPVHPDEKELVSGGIRVLYLPPNVTATVQPMDQNVLENLKQKYRRNFLEFIVQQLEDNRDVRSAIKSVNILNIIHWSADAWNNVDASTIARSWKGLFLTTYKPDDDNDINECDNRVAEMEDLTNLQHLLNNLPISEHISLEEPDIEESAVHNLAVSVCPSTIFSLVDKVVTCLMVKDLRRSVEKGGLRRSQRMVMRTKSDGHLEEGT